MHALLHTTRRAKQAGVAVVFSLQDAADHAAQGIDVSEVAANCAAAGVRHVNFPTSDEGKWVGRMARIRAL